jgi:ferrous-iron efflux pump FieF
MALSKNQWLTLASSASVLVATLLVVSKFIAWWITGSTSVMASLLDSLMDVIASVINWVAIRMSLAPADKEHRYGHGKIESLAGLAQAMFIAGSAFLLLLHVGQQWTQESFVEQTNVGIGVMVFSIALTLGLLMIQKAAVRHTGSVAIEADSLHYAGDMLMNVAVIIALIMASYGMSSIDSFFALAIGAYLLFSAWKVAKKSVQLLMDHTLDDDDVSAIKSVLNNAEDTLGFHDLRTRQSGQTHFVQLHLELPGHLTLHEAHKITERIENDISALHDPSDVVIHQDPV